MLARIECLFQHNLYSVSELGKAPAQACFDDLTFPVPLGSQSCSLTMVAIKFCLDFDHSFNHALVTSEMV